MCDCPSSYVGSAAVVILVCDAEDLAGRVFTLLAANETALFIKRILCYTVFFLLPLILNNLTRGKP